MNKNYFLIVLLLSTLVGAQEGASFRVSKQFYVHGDAISIGNNILSKHKKTPFSTKNIVNDQINMKYVDIDNDYSTFSSSSAHLTLAKNNIKIVYAGLYWSAIYGYKKGVKKINGKKIFFKGKDERDSVFNIVKFKTPNADYKMVTGKVLYDGYKKEKFKESSPYVCYADVTNLMDNNNLSGSYTIANVKATEGFTLGGSSAGWVLYVVYTTQNKKPKYITTYHGLSDVEKNKPLDIVLNQFKNNSVGNIDASITMAALEGDSNLKQDQSLIISPKDNKFIPLFNKIRDKKNFFNSSITTKDNELFTNRIPNSKNTLGFDLGQMKVPNENNKIIGNNTTETTLRFRTKSDRFYLFFAAFETEISQEYYTVKQSDNTVVVKETKSAALKNLDPVANNNLAINKASTKVKLSMESTKLEAVDTIKKDENAEQSTVVAASPNTVALKDKPLRLQRQNEAITVANTKVKSSIESTKLEAVDTIKKDINAEQSTVVATSPNTVAIKDKPLRLQSQNEAINKILNSTGYDSLNIPKGYYIITNVFSKTQLADRWNALLLKRGHQTQRFINPKNNWYYISIFYTKNIYEALKERDRLEALNYFNNLWVLKSI